MAAKKKQPDYEQIYRRYNFIRIWKKRYYHMNDRHEGRASHYSHCEGKGILTIQEFLEWCMDFENLQVFLTIYFEWASEGFPLGLSPSVDRIDSTKGYVHGNLQWLTFDQNTEKNHKYVDPITRKMVQIKEEVAA